MDAARPLEPPRGTHSAATYGAMTLHVFFAAGTYVFGKSAAVGVSDPAALTLLRALGASVLCLLLTGWAIPAPRFTRREWMEVLALGALLVPMNQYLFMAGLKDTVASHPALIYSMTPVGVLALGAALDRRAPPKLWLLGVALALGALLVPMNQYLFMAGLKDTVASHPALIYSMTPVGVLALGAALDRRAPPKLWLLGVALALGGVLVVLKPWSDDRALASVRGGDILILIGLLVWVVYTVWAGALARRTDPRTVTVWTLVLGTVLFLPVGAVPLLNVHFASLAPKTWFGIAWLAVITSTVMMLLWNQMLRTLAPVQVAVCANAQPAATALLGAVLAALGVIDHDPGLSIEFWIGTVLVVAGVLTVQRRARTAPGASR